MSEEKKKDKTGAFADYLSLTDDIAKDTSYSAKTQLVANFLKKFKYVNYGIYHTPLHNPLHTSFSLFSSLPSSQFFFVPPLLKFSTLHHKLH